jgi:hypothetical protein
MLQRLRSPSCLVVLGSCPALLAQQLAIPLASAFLGCGFVLLLGLIVQHHEALGDGNCGADR